MRHQMPLNRTGVKNEAKEIILTDYKKRRVTIICVTGDENRQKQN